MSGIFRWTRHLTEERLFECYLAERGGEGIDPPSAEHLTDCAACHAQYVELLKFMDGMWSDADAETAAVFTADRLSAQQQEIARRLELVGQSGRVLTFKSGSDVSRSAPHGPARAISRIAAGWIAAAAAAGLIVGVAAGILYDSSQRPPSVGTPALAQPVQTSEPVQVNAPPAPVPGDNGDTSELEAVELEAVLQRPRARELMMFDMITPHARDAAYLIP